MKLPTVLGLMALASLCGCGFLPEATQSPAPESKPCVLAIFWLPSGAVIEQQPLPSDAKLLASGGDFDLAASTVEDDAGQRTAVFQLRGGAVERFSNWTANHLGEYLAVQINGVVVSVPVIRAGVDDGRIALAPSGVGSDAFRRTFGGCFQLAPG